MPKVNQINKMGNPSRIPSFLNKSPQDTQFESQICPLANSKLSEN